MIDTGIQIAKSLLLATEFWAAIAGAVLGGLIALVLQLVAFREARSERANQEFKRRQASAHSLILNMVRIHATFHHFRNHIVERLQIAKELGASDDPWQAYMPLANEPSPVSFSTSEVVLLLSLGEDDLFNDVASLDEVQKATIGLFRTLNKVHQELVHMIPSEMDGGAGSATLTQEQVNALKPRMYQVNQLMQNAHKWCVKEEETASHLLDKLQKVMNNKLEMSLKLTHPKN